MEWFSGLDSATRQKLDRRVLDVFDAAVTAGDLTLQSQAQALRDYIYGPDATAETALALVRTFELFASERLKKRTTYPRVTGTATSPASTTDTTASSPSTGALALASAPKAGLPLWLWLALGGAAVGLYFAWKR